MYKALSAVLWADDFYLSGGTALALIEAHRISSDLGLFAPSIGEPDALAHRISHGCGPVVVTSVANETLYLRIRDIQVVSSAPITPCFSPRSSGYRIDPTSLAP